MHLPVAQIPLQAWPRADADVRPERRRLYAGRNPGLGHGMAGPPTQTAAATSPPAPGEPKAGNIATPQPRPEPQPVDPEADAKRRTAAEKHAHETRRTVRAATEELDAWIADHSPHSLPSWRICQRAAAASPRALWMARQRHPPAALMTCPSAFCRRCQGTDRRRHRRTGQPRLARPRLAQQSTDAELKRDIIACSAETRDEPLVDPAARRITTTWQVLGERVATQRDGLVSIATWLMSLGETASHFAVLPDFFPASAGRCGGALGSETK
jgi:hypothetical protein